MIERSGGWCFGHVLPETPPFVFLCAALTLGHAVNAAEGPTSAVAAEALRRDHLITGPWLRDVKGRYDGYDDRGELESAIIANANAKVLDGILQINIADDAVFSPRGASETEELLFVLDLASRYCPSVELSDGRPTAVIARDIAAQILTETDGSPTIEHVRQRDLLKRVILSTRHSDPNCPDTTGMTDQALVAKVAEISAS